MTSKKLVTIEDIPNKFEVVEELKTSGYWDTSVFDLYRDSVTRELIDMHSGKSYTLSSYLSNDIDYISGTNHLFTSNTPNPYYTNLVNDDGNGGNCLQIKSSGPGQKGVWFGKKYIMDYLSTQDKYRWIAPRGLSFKLKVHNPNSQDANFIIQNLSFVYKKKYETKFYSSCMIKDRVVCNTNSLSLNDKDSHVYYIEQNAIDELLRNKYYCLGLFLEYSSDTDSAIDIYNFKPIFSDYRINKLNSVCILPSPMTLDKRQSLKSSSVL